MPELIDGLGVDLGADRDSELHGNPDKYHHADANARTGGNVQYAPSVTGDLDARLQPRRTSPR